MAFYNCMSKNVIKLISSRVLCTSVTNRVLSWFNRFTVYYNCMRKNVTKLISPRVLCTNVTNRVISWFDRFTVISILWAKMSQNSYLHEFCAQVSQIVFLADLTVLQLIYKCMSKNVTKLISPRVLCTSITNRVLSWFHRFMAYYNCMSENITKLISSRVLCTSVTNHVLSWFNRFTAFYNCMSKNVTKLISPRVLCTKVTNRVLSWFDRFTVITTLWAKMSQNSYLRKFCAHYHKSCS